MGADILREGDKTSIAYSRSVTIICSPDETRLSSYDVMCFAESLLFPGTIMAHDRF